MSKSDVIAAMRPVINLLEELNIPYYIGGSIASSSLGIARATMDVDIITSISLMHVERIVQLLDENYYVDSEMIIDAIKHKSTFNVIHHDTSYKIDFFISKTTEYQQSIFERISRKKLVDKDDVIEVFICAPEDVILTKLIWYIARGGTSEKQWNDIVGVLKIQKNTLDMNYLLNWAEKLSVKSELENALTDAGVH
ncbi:MAG TPA: hypothetical protein ENN33_09320 [Ignavibacteria bacterium]|nr:hypothetical protein [Ignavibacteria bacterium]